MTRSKLSAPALHSHDKPALTENANPTRSEAGTGSPARCSLCRKLAGSCRHWGLGQYRPCRPISTSPVFSQLTAKIAKGRNLSPQGSSTVSRPGRDLVRFRQHLFGISLSDAISSHLIFLALVEYHGAKRRLTQRIECSGLSAVQRRGPEADPKAFRVGKLWDISAAID